MLTLQTMHNNVEKYLDECRGMNDKNGNYFYNVMSKPNWDILNCFNGDPKKISKDDNTIYYQSKVKERDKIVIKNGVSEII